MHTPQHKSAAKAPAAESAPKKAAQPTGVASRPPAWVNGLPLQPKLTVNEPGDLYEQEADAVAEQVMRMPAPGSTGKRVQRCACGGTAGPDGECEECKARRLALQRKGDSMSGSEAPQSVHQTLNRPGQPLDDSTRDFMESRFGADFSGVRVHSDSQAAQSAWDVAARAYTVGNDVVFGAGQYTPGSERGNRLLAHELTHVVQQGNGSSGAAARTVQMAWRYHQPSDDFLQRANLPGWVIDLMPGALGPLARDIDRAGGIFAYIENLLGGIVNRVFGGLQQGASTVGELISSFTQLFGSVGSLAAAIASGNRESFNQAVNDLTSALQVILGHGWDALESLLGPVAGFLDRVLNLLDQPVAEGIQQFAGDIWNRAIGIGQTIWNLVHESSIPGAGTAWEYIRNWLGITGPDTYDTVVQWIEGKVSQVWGAIKGRMSGVLATVRETVTTIRQVISVENIRAMRASVDGWIVNVRDMVLNLNGDEGNGIVTAQTILREVLIPAVKRGAASLRTGIVDAGIWIASLIGSLATKVKNFLDGARSNTLLSIIPEAFDWVTVKVDELSTWAQNTVVGLFTTVGDGIVTLSSYVEPVLDTLINLASTTVDLVANLPGLLTAAWNAIPAWIREPIKKFVLEQVLGRIPLFKELVNDPTIWERAQATAMRILQQIFVSGDLMGAAWTFFQALLELLHFPTQLVVQIVEKAVNVFNQIFNDPISFFKNLLGAVKKGFSNFFDHIGQHLLNGLSKWLLGEAAKAGIQPPADLSLGSIFQFVLDVLGINMELIWERLALKIGADKVAQIRRAIHILGEAWEWISLAVTQGPGALWEKLQEKISELWNQVVNGAIDWITTTLIEKAVVKILSMLDPTGIMAVVNSVIAIYNAIESFVEYVTEMLQLVNKVLDGIQEIANGVLDTAANFLEGALADSLPIAIAFLANQVGLGKLGEKLGEIIQKVREYVVKGIDWLIDKALQLGRSALDALGFGNKGQGQQEQAKKDEIKFTANDGEHRVFIENGAIMTNPDPKIQLTSRINHYEAKMKTHLPRKEDKDKAIEAIKGIRDILAKPASTSEIDPEITKHLITLVNLFGADGNPGMVTKVSWGQDGNNKWVSADPLTLKKGNTTGHASTSKAEGWEEAQNLRATFPDRHWRRLHLLHFDMFGPNEAWNFAIGSQRFNSQMEKVETKVLSALGSGDGNRALTYRITARMLTGKWVYFTDRVTLEVTGLKEGSPAELEKRTIEATPTDLPY